MPAKKTVARTRPGPSRPRKNALKTFYTADRTKWRAWLKTHYKIEQEVWLVYYRAGSGKPRLVYNDAVEEALCFGWIDSTVKKLDQRRFAQRFSPRKAGSPFSQANKERIRRLAAHGKLVVDMRPLLASFDREKFEIAPDILKALRSNASVWENFQGFSDAYKRIRVSFIEGARGRPEEFVKRLRYFVRMTEKNKLYGFGGIEKYY